jgi:serine/threonine protein kinase/WD40 repeat protein
MDSERERLLDEVVTAYVKAVDAGAAPDRAELLARHPDLADDLAAFFAAESQVKRAAVPLRPPAAEPPTMGPSEPPPTGPGTRVEYFGDYHLLAEVGRGGMGVVYKARQETLNRTVALKMILGGQLATEADVRRFRAEAEAAARLDHPGIVPVFEVGQHEGQHYFSMAFVEGESLAHRLARGLPAPREAAELTRQVAEAVAYAHVEGVVHRDLKPANILIDRDGRPRLTDFGLARRVEGGSGLTATGQIVGTPSYMPPEQASGRGDAVGPAADVYSLGAVLYCLLTGRPPFQADNPLDTLLQVLERDPAPPRQLNAAVPRDLETICLKCLEKDPKKRYPSAQKLAADLEHFLNDRPIQARPVSRTERLWRWCRRNPMVAALTMALLLALVTGTLASTFMAIRAKNEANISAGLTVKAKELAARASASERLTRRYLFSAHMNLAHEAWKSGNVLRMVELLNQHRPGAEQEDLRSFEWHYLWREAHRQRKSITLTTREKVAPIVVSPDGRWIALGVFGGWFSQRGEDSRFGEIKLWDITAGKLRHTIHGKLQPEDNNPEKLFQAPVFSPDGKLFAVVVFDFPMVWHKDAKGDGWGERLPRVPRITVWDVETLKVRATIPLPNFIPGDRIAISPDNKRVAAGFTSETGKKRVYSISVWGLPAGDNAPVGPPQLRRQAQSNQGDRGFPCLAFTADGKSLLWNRWNDQQLTVTSVTGEGKDVSWPIHSWPIHVHRTRMSADGKYLASDWGDNTVRLYDAKTGKELHQFAGWKGWFSRFTPCCFSPDSRLLAIVRGLTVDVWDVATKMQVGEICGPNDFISTVGFADGGKTVITVAKDRHTGNVEVRFWDANLRPGPDTIHSSEYLPKRAGRFGGLPPQSFIAPIVSPDGKTIATMWSWAQAGNGWKQSQAVLLHDFSSGSLGKQLLHLKWDWDDASNTPKHFRPVHLIFAPGGKRLAFSGGGALSPTEKIQLWRLEPDAGGIKATFERTLAAPQREGDRLPPGVFSPDGAKFAYPRRESDRNDSQAERLHILDVATGKEAVLPADPKAWFPHAAGLRWEGSCHGIVFSAEGKRIFTGQNRSRLIAWDAATGRVLAVLKSPVPLSHGWQPLALSHDGRLLATCQEDHSIFLWDVSEPALRAVRAELKRRAEQQGKNPAEPACRPRAVLRGHGGNVTAVAFHPDGKTLASASVDGTIKFWDVVTGEVRLSMDAHPATALVFTQDGNTLISTDIRGTVKLWRGPAAR